MSMGKRSWLFIALVTLAVTISYAEEAKNTVTTEGAPAVKVNSIDVHEKPLKKDAERVKDVHAVEPTKSVETKQTKKAETSKSSKINEIHKNESTEDEDYYNDYSDYYDDDDKTTKSSDKVTVESLKKVAPGTKTTDKDIKLRPIEKTKVTTKTSTTSKPDDEDSGDEDDDEYENLDDVDALKCPRDCTCVRNLNNYLVATCSRLDADIQKFTTSITDLEVINISPKYPIVLGAGFFKNIGLEHVSSIKIINSTIESIHQSAFEGLTELYSVNLTRNGLDVLHPDTFASNTKLRLLTLAGNDLHAMQRAVSPFTDYMLKTASLEELDISNCGLKQVLVTAFNKLDNIVFINLAHNALKTLPAGLFDDVETIEELDLSYNSISSLPENLFNRTALGILNLSHNRIKSKIDFGTPELGALDLSHNKIESISNTMFKRFEGLTNLDLRNNSIRKINQAAFAPLKKLRNIDLSANALEQISASIFTTNRDLDIIRLNDNTGLKKLPLDGFESEAGTFDVKIFDVSNCDLSDLSEKTFSTMPKMTKLNLAWNNIEVLTKGVFSTLFKLVDLDLSNNVINEMDDLVFRNNKNLKKLNLAGNELERISPRLFMSNKDLFHLDISDCELTDLWAEPLPRISILRNLKMLNVSYNKIVEVRQSDLAPLESLAILDLTSNELRCDTDFKNLLKWLQKKNIRSGNAGIGFNANMQKNDMVETSKGFNSWADVEDVMCLKKVTTPSQTDADDSKDINESEIVDEIDDDDYDDDDDDDSDDDEEAEVITKDSLIAEELDVIKGLNERLLDLEENVIEGREGINFGSYPYLAPILVTVISVLVLMLVVAKLVSLMMHRRYERYREALLASKNSIIYQKLSEDIVAPTTPKVHRYAPINQV